MYNISLPYLLWQVSYRVVSKHITFKSQKWLN
jgi:hypothetical protein